MTPGIAPDLATAVAESAPDVVEPAKSEINHHDLATQLVAKLCHDFISPAGAIMSGLDLLDDPSAQDMRQEALNLIAVSAKKMVTLVQFARVAFGAATSAEAFSGKELNKILSDIYSTMRAQLDFAIDDGLIFPKPAARALLNLGLIAGNSLPVGGTATIRAEIAESEIHLTAESHGPRARLKTEVVEGLKGLPLGEGLAGQWIQPHWLYSTVHEAKGQLDFRTDTDALFFDIRLPRA
ncbi:MAG: histidine phosphotransferase [Asticcacaulis sp.]|nr:histidine phosphotransferase [Asticcacaulis sp.]